MNDIEYIANSYYEKVSLSPIYSEHIKNIEKGVLGSYLIHPDLKIEVLNALKICYLDNGTENLFESKEYNKGRKFLIANICKFIDEKTEELNHVKNKKKDTIIIKENINKQTKIYTKFLKNQTNKNYTQKQIAIAYYIMGITINEKNAVGILEKYSQTRSLKILQKLITKNSQLITLSNNKTADTKHLENLKAAKRLLSGIKDKNGFKDIDSIITMFQEAYNRQY